MIPDQSFVRLGTFDRGYDGAGSPRLGGSLITSVYTETLVDGQWVTTRHCLDPDIPYDSDGVRFLAPGSRARGFELSGQPARVGQSVQIVTLDGILEDFIQEVYRYNRPDPFPPMDLLDHPWGFRLTQSRFEHGDSGAPVLVAGRVIGLVAAGPSLCIDATSRERWAY